MTVRSLDHIALWVADRDSITEYAVGNFGMHVIERTEAFTLLGVDARRFKLTLFAADGPRERGALKHVALRVEDGDVGRHDLGDGLVVDVVRGPTEREYDLDHVALWSADPAATARQYLALGFEPAEPRDGVARVGVDGAFVELHRGEPGEPDRPLLNHLGLLVDRADDAKELGVEVADVVDAPNTYAVFVRGPEGVKIEYVEHKPTFSLV